MQSVRVLASLCAPASESCGGEIKVSFRDKTIPLFQFALSAQREGAVALLLTDREEDAKCAGERYDQKCMPGGNKALNEGFAAADEEKFWENVKIPIFYATKSIYSQVIAALSQPQSSPPISLDSTERRRDEL